jgi:hypothetical protein
MARSDVSRTSNLSLSTYLRTSQGLVGQDNMGNDLLMGRLDLTPVLDAHVGHFFIVVRMNNVMTQTIAHLGPMVQRNLRLRIVPSYHRV